LMNVSLPCISSFADWHTLEPSSMNSLISLLEKCTFQQAKQAISDQLSNVLLYFRESPSNRFPIGVIEDRRVKGSVDSKTSIVVISKETLEKQNTKHPELELQHYTRIQKLLDRSEVIKEGRNNYQRHLLFLHPTYEKHCKWLKVCVKATKDGKELFLVTFHLLDDRQLWVLRSQGVLLRESAKPFHFFSSYEIY